MGEDLIKLKASIKNISQVIRKAPVERIPEPKALPTAPKPVTKQKP